MTHKIAETRWKKICNVYGMYSHKYGDVRYCPHCEVALPKSEKAPDYACAPIAIWVECKNSIPSTGRWAWTEISPTGARKGQREFLLEHGGWIFIELGQGAAPKGKSAYLLPFEEWVSKVEPILIENNMSSIRREDSGKRPGGDTLLKNWKLEWFHNRDWSFWSIPDGHLWWTMLTTQLWFSVAETKKHMKDQVNDGLGANS